MNLQKGFTLIELVMVIVILGILSVVAVPLYIDLKSDAAQAAVNGVAGGLSSAMSVNFAARTANSAKGVAVTNCNTWTVLAGGQPTNGGVYAITSAVIAPGATVTCTLTFTPTGGTPVTATFSGMGIN